MDTHQAADHDFAFRRDRVSVLDSLSRRLGSLGGLLHTSDRDRSVGSLGSRATSATASALATADEDLVERLVQLGRHDEKRSMKLCRVGCR